MKLTNKLGNDILGYVGLQISTYVTPVNIFKIRSEHQLYKKRIVHNLNEGDYNRTYCECC